MADLILHHYLTSPFSEKVRLILGAKKLPWKSVFIPPIMPKPEVEVLTGGYRKTPFLQIGADMYCDSALIADVLEHLQPEPTLYPEPEKGLSRILAQWADTTLFWASMAWNLQPKGAAEVFAKAPPEALKAFGEDRGKMSAGNMTRLRPADATSAYKSYLRRLSDMLDDKPFLLGEVPSIADFSAYHSLWYTRRIEAVRTILELTPAVVDWMDRMAAIGHGAPEKFTADEAIAVAKAATPHTLLTDSTFQDDHGIALGSAVTIRAESFGLEETPGTLVAATRTHYTLARSSERTGTVHVHFPRIGYVLKAAEA
ncbi:Glutathione S-transferase [Variovorax sp. OK605]|jgi:glutathione S-transferase|uniref:glutathione S-transferase family protein n=1 Tax=unclassified Variovorax TaxID=663243 RepID=UPI0008B21E0E|nr:MULTISPECIES: glutathione S-transferase family protein [unclassified Variovorax]SEJ78464.1 Glutathione S-transferase [Variovorax sp. OK202]SFC91429.1 Glutathione S-transferase [Variovorax sp. OK212]SFO53527.1 Glutathione S-transferase [Variovorax sp. OK605]